MNDSDYNNVKKFQKIKPNINSWDSAYYMKLQKEKNKNTNYPKGKNYHSSYQPNNEEEEKGEEEEEEYEELVYENSEEIKAPSTEEIKAPSTEEIIRMAIIFSKHKESKLVQLEYERGNKDIKNKIFEALKSEILILSKNEIGYHVIKTILKYGDKENIEHFFDKIKNYIFELSSHKYGYIVIQILIEVLEKIDKNKIKIILEKLYDLLSELNKYGNFVLQKIIRILQFEDIKIIYNEVLKNIKYLINNKYGSWILQLILYKYNEEQKQEQES